MTTPDLRSLISACPGLCELDLRGFVASDADLSPLLQLPATCCSLKVGGHAFEDSHAAGLIGQLTQLTRLVWTNSPGLTEAGLLSLTALQGLQSFFIRENHNLSGALVDKYEGEMWGDFELKTTDEVRHQNLPASTVSWLLTHTVAQAAHSCS